MLSITVPFVTRTFLYQIIFQPTLRQILYFIAAGLSVSKEESMKDEKERKKSESIFQFESPKAALWWRENRKKERKRRGKGIRGFSGVELLQDFVWQLGKEARRRAAQKLREDRHPLQTLYRDIQEMSGGLRTLWICVFILRTGVWSPSA